MLAVFLMGCSSTHMNQPSAPVHYSADAGIAADLNVGEKIEGKAKLLQIFGFINIGPNKFADGVNFSAEGRTGRGSLLSGGFFDRFADIKSAAAYDAVSTANADVIVSPRYVIEVEDYFIFNTTSATVSGYKGTINKFTNTYKLDPNNFVR